MEKEFSVDTVHPPWRFCHLYLLSWVCWSICFCVSLSAYCSFELCFNCRPHDPLLQVLHQMWQHYLGFNIFFLDFMKFLEIIDVCCFYSCIHLQNSCKLAFTPVIFTVQIQQLLGMPGSVGVFCICLVERNRCKPFSDLPLSLLLELDRS